MYACTFAVLPLKIGVFVVSRLTRSYCFVRLFKASDFDHVVYTVWLLEWVFVPTLLVFKSKPLVPLAVSLIAQDSAFGGKSVGDAV